MSGQFTNLITDPIERIRIGLTECERELGRNDLPFQRRADLELRRRNAQQWLRAASDEGLREVKTALGHTPSRNEIMLYFVENGGAEEFARTH